MSQFKIFCHNSSLLPTLSRRGYVVDVVVARAPARRPSSTSSSSSRALVRRSDDVHGERDGGRVEGERGVGARRRRRPGRRAEFASNARAHAERSKTASNDAGVKGEVGANARIGVDGGGVRGGRAAAVARESRPAPPSRARAAHHPSHRPERIVVKHKRALIVRLERVGSFSVRQRPKLFTHAHDGALFYRERIHPARRALGAPLTDSLTRSRERLARLGDGGVVVTNVVVVVVVITTTPCIHHRTTETIIARASRRRAIEGVVHHLHAQIIERARRYLAARHRRARVVE